MNYELRIFSKQILIIEIYIFKIVNIYYVLNYANSQFQNFSTSIFQIRILKSQNDGLRSMLCSKP